MPFASGPERDPAAATASQRSISSGGRALCAARDYLALSVTEIRQYGGSSVQVVRRLRALLLHLQRHVLPEHRAAVDAELARLEATVAARFGEGVDLDRALEPDRQGLGGPGRAHAQAETAVAGAGVPRGGASSSRTATPLTSGATSSSKAHR
jgi:hypothetical protein